MAARKKAGVAFDNVAELVERIGNVPLERIRMRPPPGTATEADVVTALDGPNKRLCELVDGVLVEKVMGIRESRLATVLGRRLDEFAERHGLGMVCCADGPVRVLPKLVRLPDVMFLNWDRLPGRELPDKAILGVVPDLAVEVLSKGNTKAEMERKLREYFLAGVRLVWLIYPKKRTAEVCTSPEDRRRIEAAEALDGGDVLPGFRLTLEYLFASTRAPRSGR
jgi:Uma2 family endonuclease